MSSKTSFAADKPLSAAGALGLIFGTLGKGTGHIFYHNVGIVYD
jgi:hypothetical protein